jgi:hypothetical protein
MGASLVVGRRGVSDSGTRGQHACRRSVTGTNIGKRGTARWGPTQEQVAGLNSKKMKSNSI